MPLTLIKSNPTEQLIAPEGQPVLRVAELFCNTIQGEGVSVGMPATFLRLQGCTLSCKWCDTLEVWRDGNPYTIDQLLDIFSKYPDVLKTMFNGVHSQRLILTGGSPLKQQHQLIQFIYAFRDRFRFDPCIEVENEVTIPVMRRMELFVHQWNNSPKLSNSGMPKAARYKPEIIAETAKFDNSWFKFVIKGYDDWEEIEQDFLKPGLISRSQIILMPEGATREELQSHYDEVVSLCTKESVRFSDRLHITCWDRKTGV